MATSYHNQRPNRASRTGNSLSAGATGDLSAARNAARRSGGGRPPRSSSSRQRGSRASNFMRYAADNRIVQAIYGFTTGPSRYVFFGLVVLAVLIGVYFPVRDLYTAYRTGDILERQLEVRNAYNEQLEGEVNRLLSTEGIEDVAREELGLVMPGEHSVTVIGIDDEPAEEGDGTKDPDSIPNPNDASAEAEDAEKASDDGEASKDTDPKDAEQKDANAEDADSKTDADSDDSANKANEAGDAEKSENPTTSSEVEEAELAVVDDAPWYIKLLDVLFFYQGVEGQTVMSTGE